MRFLNPLKLLQTASNLHAVSAGGGPKAVHLVRVGAPRGLIVQSSEVVVDVETRSGTKVRLDPNVPMPFLVGWGIRLARKLGVPVISSLEPESFAFRFGVPGRGPAET
jgi:hypothetical protein